MVKRVNRNRGKWHLKGGNVKKFKKLLLISLSLALVTVLLAPVAVLAALTSPSLSVADDGAGVITTYTLGWTSDADDMSDNATGTETLIVTFPSGYDASSASLSSLTIAAVPATGCSITAWTATTVTITDATPETWTDKAIVLVLGNIQNPIATGDYEIKISTKDDLGVPMETDAAVGTVTINPGPLHHIVVSPDTASIPCGGSQTYTAEAFDQYDQSRGDVTAGTDWEIEAGAGGSWVDNVYSAEYEGTWTVTGTYIGKSDTASLTVCVGVGGEAYFIDKLTILAPWLGLVLILVIGASVFIRRWQRAR